MENNGAAIIKEIVEQVHKLTICETRRVSENYYEFVCFTAEREALNEIFNDIFGSSIKPTGAMPTHKDSKTTKKLGGIRSYQKLYIKEAGDGIVVAMFRPWRDEAHITVIAATIKWGDIQNVGALMAFFDRAALKIKNFLTKIGLSLK